MAQAEPVNAVAPLKGAGFENLFVSRHEGRTRATLKIQEGCNHRCTYCIIPSVRGPISSRPLEEILRETRALAEAGYRELVLTGIHLASWGKEWENELGLMDAIEAICQVPGILRVRLGSLEPTVVTEDFVRRLARQPKVCPQFHLALQSGSDTVLQRMARGYRMGTYRRAVALIRSVYPDAALTTDILTGFPGETQEEYEETCRIIEELGFARIHVFPYSQREGTPAARMPGQLPEGGAGPSADCPGRQNRSGISGAMDGTKRFCPRGGSGRRRKLAGLHAGIHPGCPAGGCAGLSRRDCGGLPDRSDEGWNERKNRP